MASLFLYYTKYIYTESSGDVDSLGALSVGGDSVAYSLSNSLTACACVTSTMAPPLLLMVHPRLSLVPLVTPSVVTAEERTSAAEPVGISLAEEITKRLLLEVILFEHVVEAEEVVVGMALVLLSAVELSSVEVELLPAELLAEEVAEEVVVEGEGEAPVACGTLLPRGTPASPVSSLMTHHVVSSSFLIVC